MRSRLITAVGVLACASSLGAQTEARPITPEIRPLVGVYMPTGQMRDELKAATMLGVQGALELSRNWHVLGNVTWAHGHNKYALSTDRTDVWQYDVGAEGNLVRSMGGRWLLRPFLGLGAGGRTYDHHAGALESKTCTAAYGSLGSEVQWLRVALRLEGRGYLSCFESPTTRKKDTRNDVGLSVGLAFHLP